MKLAKGRKSRYSEYETLLESVSTQITKRPKYLNGIGIMHGKRGFTAWVKVKLTRGGTFKGQYYAPGAYLEIKLGNLPSYNWEQLEAEFKALQGKADRGEPLEEKQDITFSEYVETWLVYAGGRIDRKANLKNLKRDIHNRLIPFFGPKGLQSITPADVNLWQAKQRVDLSISSVQRNKNNLRSILNRAQKDGLIEKNPCDYSDKMKVPEAEPRYIRDFELRKLFSHAPEINRWLRDYLLWCLLSGMRQGEIRDLKWSNVVFQDTGKAYLSFRTGKTRKIRNVTCTKSMTEILYGLKKEATTTEDKVFPYPQIAIKRAWNRLRKLTELRDIKLQHFRTSNATIAATSGVDLRTLGGRLGHADLEMLQRHYAGLQRSAEAQAATKIECAVDDILKVNSDVQIE